MISKIVEIDVHGLKRLEAKEFIYQELKKCIKNHIYTIRIIHGFNNGTVIKDWLINSKDLLNDFNISKVESDPINSGATLIYLKI